jgi:hypothetical protein
MVWGSDEVASGVSYLASMLSSLSFRYPTASSQLAELEPRPVASITRSAATGPDLILMVGLVDLNHRPRPYQYCGHY